MQMVDYKYIIKPRASRKVFSFYSNVAKKYRHTYDRENLKRDVQNAVFSMYQIERTLLRREPTLTRWNGYHMANTDKWYFAYTFDGETVTVVDACHAQNMHENYNSQRLKFIFEREMLVRLRRAYAKNFGCLVIR